LPRERIGVISASRCRYRGVGLVMISMDVELLVTYDCPGEAVVHVLLRVALDEAGLPETRIRTTTVTSQAHAEMLGFVGSPTVRLDGIDPFADPDQNQAALACRLYRAPGGPAGVPDYAALRRAVQHAAGVRPL
jgi:hypothetical protein